MRTENEPMLETDAALDADCRAVANRLRAVPERPYPDISSAVMRRIACRRRWRAGVLTTAAAAAAAAAVVMVRVGDPRMDAESAVPAPDTVLAVTQPATSPIDWLLAAQEQDGTWDPARWGGSAVYPHAATGFAVLALVEGGQTAHDDEIARAIWALRAGQSPDGRLGGGTGAGLMLNHAVATAALLAAHETGRFPQAFTALDGAIGWMRSRQDAHGGWGGGDTADLWLVDVLARATEAGWPDRGGHVRRGLRRIEAAGGAVSQDLAAASGLAEKRRAVTLAREKWTAANPAIRGGGTVYAQAVAAR